MKRILVIGSPGSGKSTVAKALSKKYDIPVIHLDKLFWKSGWVQTSHEEFDKKLLSELEKDEWVIDGNYSRTLDLRLKYADTVIFFDYPTYICVWRVIKRVITNHGKVRSDIGDNCPERFDADFLKYVMRFRKNNRRKLSERLESCGIDVITIHNTAEFKQFEDKYIK